MIAIINQDKDKDGQSLYNVQINDKLICQFYHTRSDGLGECLRKAAVAVDVHMENEVFELMKKLKEA